MQLRQRRGVTLLVLGAIAVALVHLLQLGDERGALRGVEGVVQGVDRGGHGELGVGDHGLERGLLRGGLARVERPLLHAGGQRLGHLAQRLLVRRQLEAQRLLDVGHRRALIGAQVQRLDLPEDPVRRPSFGGRCLRGLGLGGRGLRGGEAFVQATAPSAATETTETRERRETMRERQSFMAGTSMKLKVARSPPLSRAEALALHFFTAPEHAVNRREKTSPKRARSPAPPRC